MKVVHDRLNVEIARGCKRGCRFCEAGFIHRPYRERDPGVIHEILDASLEGTGYEEISLLSLSAGDYSSIGPLLSGLMDRFESKRVAVSFPSLRIESVVGRLAEEVKRVRKTGFTIAPEAGTERLRKVINKELDEGVLFQGLSDLFSKGWKNIKLYFMMGLPTEKEEDLRGIIDLSEKDCFPRREAEGPSQYQCQCLHLCSQTPYPFPVGIPNPFGGDEGETPFPEGWRLKGTVFALNGRIPISVS